MSIRVEDTNESKLGYIRTENSKWVALDLKFARICMRVGGGGTF